MISSDAGPLIEYLASQRAYIECALELYLPKPPLCPAVVGEAIKYSVMSGGKRFRPILTLASAEAIGDIAGRPGVEARRNLNRVRETALPVACAIEFIHTYSLIHDDLPAMDNDPLRRGRPTLHVVYGEGLAILAGDGLLTEAFALMAREPAEGNAVSADRRLRVLQRVAEAAGVIGMVGGQAIDLQATGGHHALDGSALREMHGRKTGALIRAAASAGAIVAGGTDEQVQAIERFAAELGLAFQIIDDILDVEATTDQMGKATGKDAISGKPTYAALYGVDQSRQLAIDSIVRGREALDAAGLSDSRLTGIADWIAARTH